MNKCLGFLLLAVTHSAFATSPIVSITPQGTLPTVVTSGSQVEAKYTVTNRTPFTLTNLGLSYEPHGQTPVTVTQNTTNINTPATCANPFNLKAGQSCTLDLIISGQAKSGPEVCYQDEVTSRCSIPKASNRLNVKLSTLSYTSLAVGGYNDEFFIQSTNSGTLWTIGNLPHSLSIAPFSTTACGHGLCVIASKDTLIDSPDGVTWTNEGNFGLSINATACLQGSSLFCLAAGLSGTQGMVAQTKTANPTNWSTPLTGPTPSLFTSASCGTSICVVGGDYSPGGPGHVTMYQIVNPTTTGTWQPISVGPVSPINISANAISCDGQLCVIIADYAGGDELSFQTPDNGTTWTSNSTGLSGGTLMSVSCNEASKVCVFNMEDIAGHGRLLQSNDKGVTWTDITPQLTAVHASYYGAVSCSEVLCVAAGYDYANSVYTLYQSIGGSTTWNPVTVTGLSTTANLQTVSCKGSYCFIAGTDPGNSDAGVLIQTFDGGTTWTPYDLTTIPSFPSSMSFGASEIQSTGQ